MKAGLRSSPGVTSGSRPAAAVRRCWRAKRAKPITEPAMDSHVHSGQPFSCPWFSGSTSRVQEATIRAPPVMSTRTVRSPAFLGTNFAATTSAARPMGRLTRNTDRQPRPKKSPSMRKPPRTGPMMPPRPSTGPKIAKTLVSSGPEKFSRSRPRPWGSSIAPAVPCSRRKAISDSMFGATAHSREVAVKAVSPSRNICRRP
ncbi:hypothetical protein SCALM49S_05741 [Streptomyces californicus]